MIRHVRRHSDMNCATTAEPIEMLFVLWIMDSGGPKAACIRWGLDTRVKGQLLGGRTCPILCELRKNG